MANFHGTPFGALGAGNGWSILWEVSKKTGETITNFLGLDSVLRAYSEAWNHNANLFEKIGLIFASGTLGLVSGVLGIIGGILTFIVIALAFLIALFKLWFALIKAYVMILLDVVLAPFWIIGGIIPGSPISLGGWLKDISANLLAFPVTIAMFMLAVVFKNIFANTTTGQYFVPPLIGNPSDVDPALIGTIISLGIILMTPNVVEMLKSALKAPKTGAGPSLGNPLGAVSSAGQMGYHYQGLKSLPVVGKYLPGGKH
jgi:hypothetical protein